MIQEGYQSSPYIKIIEKTKHQLTQLFLDMPMEQANKNEIEHLMPEGLITEYVY